MIMNYEDYVETRQQFCSVEKRCFLVLLTDLSTLKLPSISLILGAFQPTNVLFKNGTIKWIKTS